MIGEKKIQIPDGTGYANHQDLK